ncbi:MAG: isoprenylcysteine carboxylmethyltransferase family protein [Cellvibrionaceae bacterium]|nr:isoprenylcysteine carboxylmethyltransferase family protein [Cellvibrionaceae bacterium]
MKKLLPPILFFITCIATVVEHFLFEVQTFIPMPMNLMGIPFVLGGLGMAIAGSNVFKHRSTNIQTFGEPGVLVTDGLYQYSRNPMYLGFCIAIFGNAVICGMSLWGVVLFVGFVLVCDLWYVRFEERELRKKFGEDYERYCAGVRRWV